MDPMAEGVLVIGVGTGTREMGVYLQGFKRYLGTGLLGEDRDTLDRFGVMVRAGCLIGSCQGTCISL